MTRETKIGMVMVLVLAGVFGFLVYKRAMKPGELVAQTDETTAADSENADPDANADDDDSLAFGQNDADTPRLTAAPARPIPASEDDELDNPFSTDEPAPRMTAANTTRIPATIPADEPDANDPFAGAEESEPAEGDPFNTAVETDDRDMVASSDPVDLEEEEFSAPITFDAPATNATARTAPAMSLPTETAGRAPALGFEAAEPSESEDFAAEEPADEQPLTPLRPSSPPVIARQPEIASDVEEETVSIQARAKLPEPTLDFGGADEPQPLEPDTEGDSRAMPTPELMLDDSDADRYGGYQAIELIDAESEASFPADEPDVNAPRRVSAESEPFASPAKSRQPATTIAGDRYVIQPGDNFWSISQKKYGTGRYFQALAAYNQSRVPDASRMKPGVEIALPAAEDLETRHASLVPGKGPAEPTAAEGATNAPGEFLRGSDGRPVYRVGTGDTLSGIAQKYLGRSLRWEQILEMNRDLLKDGNSLKLGTVLRMPTDAADIQLSNQPRVFR